MTTEDDVLDFVCQRLALRRDRVNLSDRLLVDLGMDGDDAVAFFDEFETRFEVDLTNLRDHWSEYFGPEGVTGSGPIVLAVITAVPAITLGALFHLATWAVVAIGLVIMFGSLFVIGARNNRIERENPTSRQISISDLIASVEQQSFVHDNEP